MKKRGIWKQITKITTILLINSWVFSVISLAQGPSTDVWIDVVKGPSEARISVTVPYVYAFTVMGTLDTGDDTAISVENGNLLLPNVVVIVDDDGTGQSDYRVSTVASHRLKIENFSTDVLEEHLEEENPPRVGLAIKLNASLVLPIDDYYDEHGNERVLTDQERAYWVPVGRDLTTADADFKKFRLSIDGKKFSIVDGDVIHMEDSILLEKPPLLEENGYDAGGIAYIPSVMYPETNVEVGGRRGQYYQVEQSTKVATIKWSVEPVPQASTP